MESAQKIPWSRIRPRVFLDDIPTIQLTSRQLKAIQEYGSSHFSDIGHNLTWKNAYKTGNPNTKGMIGEFAVQLYFEPDADVVEFLANRPLYQGDRGDALIVIDEPIVFDVKSRTRREDLETLLEDRYCAEMEDKFLCDGKIFLEGFVFCAGPLMEGTVAIMGYLLRKEATRYMQKIKAGHLDPLKRFAYGSAERVIPYNRLHPIRELADCPYVQLEAPERVPAYL